MNRTSRWPRIHGTLATALLAALVMVAAVPQAASAGTVLLERFASGDTDVELGFDGSITNSTLGISLPRNARILEANMSVQGILSPDGDYVVTDFDTKAIGSDLWALHKEASGIYPVDVDAYSSGWEPVPASEVADLKSVDGDYWHTETASNDSDPPEEYPVQLYHFRANVPNVISYAVSWRGYGECAANASMRSWMEVWMYDFDNDLWDQKARFSSMYTAEDWWINTTMGPIAAIRSANGSMDVAVVGPHADSDDANGTNDHGHLYTDYIGVRAKVTAGQSVYPEDVSLDVGGSRMTLSTGPLEGYVGVGDGLGFREALQALLDSKPGGAGNVTLDLTFSVGELTLAGVGVSDLHILYEVVDPGENLPPLWTGPDVLYTSEDSPWAPVLDLDATFVDDHDQGRLTFTVADVSVPSALEARVAKAVWGNWTLEVRPSADFFGPVEVRVDATDRLGATTRSPPVTVRVLAVPDAPVLVDPGVVAATERVELTVVLHAIDPDLPDDVLTFSDGSALFDVDPTTGALKWTPGPDDVGPHSFAVTVTDSFGLSDTITLRVDVANVNDAPHIVSPLAVDAVQDRQVAYTIVANDPDLPYGDMLTFSAWSTDIEVELVPSTGLLTFTPGNSHVGHIAVVLRVQDLQGASDVATLVVAVANVNEPPVIEGLGPLEYKESDSVSFRLAFDDPDLGLDMPVPEALTLGSDGPDWLRPTADGWVNFTADRSMVGERAVSYTVTDRAGLSDSVTVIVRIAAVNHAPVITTQVASTQVAIEDERFTLLLACLDSDGDTLTWSDDSPMFAIDPVTGAIGFTPVQSQVGPHAVNITVADGHGGSSSLSFTIVVQNVNDAPVVRTLLPANGSVFKEGEPVAFAVTADDEDGDALGFTWREGSAQLGAGSPLAIGSLGPGRHTITVSVTDGNATVERTIDVVVEAKDGGGSGGKGGPLPMWLGLLMVAVAVVVVAVLAVRARRGAPPADREAAGEPEGEGTPTIEVEHREV